MKKFLTLTILAVLAIVSSFSAGAFVITFNVENAESVIITCDGKVQNLQNGKNELEFDFTYSYARIEIAPTDDWKLIAVHSDEPAEYGDIEVSSGTAYDYFYTNQSGRSYTIECTNVSATRTASATVEVKGDPDRITFMRANQTLNLKEGENTVKFNPETESEFFFRNTKYAPFYAITLNGEPVALDQYSSSSYTIEAKDGDKIYIEVDYPDIDVPLTISANIPEAIKSVNVSYEAIEWENGKAISLKAGSEVTIYFNDYYKVTGVNANGEPQNVNSTYYAFKLGVEPMNIEVVAETYPELSYTINIDHPEFVSVSFGSSKYYSTPIELSAGINELTINENFANLFIEAQPGCFIESLTDGEGNDIELDWGSLKVTEGMVINIVSGKIECDSRFAMYFDGPLSSYTKAVIDDQTYVLSEDSPFFAGNNYWVIPFSSVAHKSFRLSFDPDPDYTRENAKVHTFKDLEFWETSSYIGARDVTPVDGSVYYGFCAPEAPELIDVTFTVSESTASNVKVFQSIVKELTDWTDGIKALPATLIEVEADEHTTVKVGDTEIARNDDGKFPVMVDKDNNHITITSDTSAIIDITGDRPASGNAVYNLQGIRVADCLDELPAGIYITNGKKVIKK